MFQNIVVVIIVAAAAFFLIRYFLKRKSCCAKKTADKDSDLCAGCCGCGDPNNKNSK